MRKRKILDVLDRLLWTAIAVLPIVYALFTVSATKVTGVPVTFADAVNSFFGAISFTPSNNVAYAVLNGIFGVDTYGLNLHSEPLLACLAFYVTVQLVHFAVDVLLFVVRVAHKFMDRWTND